MITVGVDLAAQPLKTAIARLHWRAGRARAGLVQLDVDDDLVIGAIGTAAVTGIDCPFGWPETFLAFLSDQRGGSPSPVVESGLEWRRGLAYRRTDFAVHELTNRWPLSVATDRIGLTAMRAVSILARLEAAGTAVDRAGGGRVVEVYPAAALRQWALPASGYKGPTRRAVLDRLLSQLLDAAPWLDLGEYEALCRHSDDAFDAVVAALIARAKAIGGSTRPSEQDQATAEREGWIVLPTGSLTDLP